MQTTIKEMFCGKCCKQLKWKKQDMFGTHFECPKCQRVEIVS